MSNFYEVTVTADFMDVHDDNQSDLSGSDNKFIKVDGEAFGINTEVDTCSVGSSVLKIDFEEEEHKPGRSSDREEEVPLMQLKPNCSSQPTTSAALPMDPAPDTQFHTDSPSSTSTEVPAVGGRFGRGSRPPKRGRGGNYRGVEGGRCRYLATVRERRRRGCKRGGSVVESNAIDSKLPKKLPDECTKLMTTEENTVCAKSMSTLLKFEEDVSETEEVEDVSEVFKWATMNGWRGEKEKFLCKNPGPTQKFENSYDAFRSFWDDDILTRITNETNRYAEGIDSDRFQQDWCATNLDEILILFAFWMMLGIIKLPTIKSCFTKLPIMRTEIFRTLFSENRYSHLNRAFHVDGDSNDPSNILEHMGPLFDQLNLKFQQNYILHQDIYIDDSLTIWKSQDVYHQYIKTKLSNCAIKSFELCESSTGYLWSFYIYTGRRGPSNAALLPSISTVVKLVKPLFDLGHVLYMDDWFNSPKLARLLKSRRTDCVGPLRTHAKYVPQILTTARLAEGEFLGRQSGDVVAVGIRDQKRIAYISTFHDLSLTLDGVRQGQPAQLKLLHDYNQGMGGFERQNQMLEPYVIDRKDYGKWPIKLFKRLLNVTIQNARILLEQSTNTKIDSLSFRLALVQLIVDNHLHNAPFRLPPCPIAEPSSPRRIHYSRFPEERLTERHFIRRIQKTHDPQLLRQRCVLCASEKISRKTSFECPQCNVALCFDCFEIFHTVR